METCQSAPMFWLTGRPDDPQPSPPEDFDGYATAMGPPVPQNDDPLLLAAVAAIERAAGATQCLEITEFE